MDSSVSPTHGEQEGTAYHLKPVVVRYQGRKVRLYFRGDAGLAEGSGALVADSGKS